MFKNRFISGQYKTHAVWSAESGLKNKGIYCENGSAFLLGDTTYTGLSTSKFDEKAARDVKAFGRKIEVKGNRGAFQMFRLPGESKAEYMARYLSKASATVYCFTVMRGAKNLNGKMDLFLLDKKDAAEYVINSRHWDFEKRPGGEVLRWKCGFVEDEDLLMSFIH